MLPKRNIPTGNVSRLCVRLRGPGWLWESLLGQDSLSVKYSQKKVLKIWKYIWTHFRLKQTKSFTNSIISVPPDELYPWNVRAVHNSWTYARFKQQRPGICKPTEPVWGKSDRYIQPVFWRPWTIWFGQCPLLISKVLQLMKEDGSAFASMNPDALRRSSKSCSTR